MDELLKKLALLHTRKDSAMEAMKAEEDKDEKKVKITELNAVMDEIDALNIEIEEAKAEEKALARVAGYEAPGKAKTRSNGAVTSSDINTEDNIYKDPNLGFKNYGDCAQAVYKAATGGGYDQRLSVIASGNPELQAAGLRQNNGPEGGFLVPPAFAAADLTNEQGTSLDLYSRTRNFQLGKEESLTLPAINETSRKDGSMYGGVTAKWLEEEATMTESEPEFRQIELRPKEIAVFIKVSDKLLRNSPIGLGQFLSFASQDVLTFKLSDSVINGDGAGKPIGILQSDALVTVLKETGQVADTVQVENTLKMKAKMTRRWLAGSAWYINKDVMPEVEVFKIGDHPVFAPANNVAGRPFDMLHNIPIVETEYSPVLGDKGDIILANLSAYVTAQHGGGIRSDSSIHFNFDQNKTAFRFLTEADGQTWLKQAITDFQGSGTTSPFVTLEERT